MRGQDRIRTAVVGVLAAAILLPAPARADGVTGYLQLTYSSSDARALEDAAPAVITETDMFLQRYNLNVDRSLFPYVRFKMGGTFETVGEESREDGQERDRTTDRSSGFADLTITNPLLKAGGNYTKRREKIDASDSAALIMLRETTTLFAGLARREKLPSLDLLLLRTETYDADRHSQDTTQDQAALTSRYSPMKELDLRLHAGQTETADRLHEFDVVNRSLNGRVSYTDQFFGGRSSLNTTYMISLESTEASATGSGDVLFQVYPSSGLASVDDTPADGALDPLPPLIDGDLLGSVGINIGSLPSSTGDTRQRNLGLDLVAATGMNTLAVWVDREVPASVAGAWTWTVSTSEDNQTWTAVPVTSVAFGPFVNRFLISFTTVTARYVKAAVRPLAAGIFVPPGYDLSSVLVTELQAFESRPAEDVRGVTRRTSQNFDLNVRSLLLQSPALVHDLTYWHRRTEPGGPGQYILVNWLSLTRQLNPVLTAGARVGREDSNEAGGHHGSSLYGVSLIAVPLERLRHTLIFSGRRERIDERSSKSSALTLDNAAEFYRGVNGSLSAGLSRATSETGEESESRTITGGATIVPLSAMTLNLAHAETLTKRWGSVPAATSEQSRNELSVAYTPVSTLYLFASLAGISERDKPSATVQNYAASWSPFGSGSIQIGIPYSQTLRSAENARDISFAPNIRWLINRRTHLTVSRQVLKSETSLLTSRTRTASADLRWVF